MGPQYGDAASVGYELLHRQVTRAQGIFSPRTVNVHFGLDYIAENLDTPAVVLQYPSKRELIEELKQGYDYVGITFIMAVMHKMKETVALIRQYAPNSRIVLGGYGTVLKDDVLKPYADFICREEGVGYFRRLLGEPEIQMPYKHPLIVSWLKVFGWKVSGTGKIFAGLGCPNGCDFCCTSHFFSRKHIKLLPTGRDIYNVVERYFDLDPGLVFLILDEDFLLNKKRALEFRECVLAGGRKPSIFAFSSIKAISQFTVEEILEMGIDGFWIGYEGTRSNYAKQQGRPVDEILTEFREHGITVLTSMIVGFDYQTPEIVAQELDGLMKLKPALGAVSDLRPGARHAVLRAHHQGEFAAGRLHDRQGFVLPARGRLSHDDQTSDALTGADRKSPELVFRAGFSTARPEHLSRAGNAFPRLPETQGFAQSGFAAEGRILCRMNCALRIRCFSPADCWVRMPPCENGSAIWNGASTRNLGNRTIAQQFKSVLAVGAAVVDGIHFEVRFLPASEIAADDVSPAGKKLERI